MKIYFILPLILGFSFGWSQEKIPLIQYSEIAEKVSETAQSGDNEKVLALLDQVPKNDSASCSALLSKSYYLMVGKDYDGALAVIDSGLTRGCPDSRALLTVNHGVALLGKEQYKEALVALEEGISQYPKNHLLWYNYGFGLEKSDRTEEALRAYQEAILINPLFKKSYLQLGNLCYRQQRITMALMCFNMVLFLEPDSADALATLQSLNNIVKNRNENESDAGISLSESEDSYREIDLILANRIALNEKYETGNPLNLALVRQNHAFMESLGGVDAAHGFWAERFVPFYKWVYESGNFDPFMYTLAFSIANDEYKKIVMRNKEEIIGFRNQALQKWLEFVKISKREWYGEEREITYYFNDGSLDGVGMMNGSTPSGPWEFFDANGRRSAQGTFDQNGNRIGKWIWFDENHNIGETMAYTDGQMEGEALEYHSNGTIKLKSHYRNNLLDGPYESFNSKGALLYKSTYREGKLEGRSFSYFPDGEIVEFEIPYLNGEIHGKAVQFFADGTKKAEYDFQAGERHGKELQYNYEGTLTSEMEYVDGKLEGKFVRYHSNGNVLEEGMAHGGNYEGEWRIYYPDGTLQNVNHYLNGLLTDTSQTYDEDSKLHFEYEYRNGEVIAYRFFDKGGNLLSEGRKKGGEFQFQGYTSAGIPEMAGLYDIKGGKNGEWTYNSPYGVLSSRSTYADNALQGDSYSYYPNGEVSSITPYVKDTLSGYATEYFQNGQMKLQGWYVADNRHGEWRYYFPDGTLESVNYYHKGELHGIQETYAPDGSLATTTSYEYGEQLGEYRFDKAGELTDSLFLDGMAPGTTKTLYHGNGKPYVSITFNYGVRSGAFTQYDYYGTKRKEGQYRNDQPEGTWRYFYPDGTLEQEITFRLGQMHGPLLRYHENGEIETRATYQFDLAEGNWTSYDEKGNQVTRTQYTKDQTHGRKEFYSEEGTLQLIRFYKHGTLTGYSYLDSLGKEVPMIPILNGSGTIKALYPNGSVSREMEYRNGELTGVYTRFSESGQLLEEIPYLDGEYHGTHKEYYPNGKVKRESAYFHGFKHGLHRHYFENGGVKREETYRSDRLHGPAKTYNTTGKLIKNEEYFNGEIIAVSKT